MYVSEFLNEPANYTHLLFIDSDIDFNASTIFKMLEKDQEVLSIPYPMKVIQWDKVLNKWIQACILLYIKFLQNNYKLLSININIL